MLDMNDHLKSWLESFLKLGSLALKSKITVVGDRNQHVGPRWESAKVQFTLEPASRFEVIDATSTDEQTRKAGYVDWAIFGLLDILLVAEYAPITKVRITIDRIEPHPIDSSQMAFRQAGRDAGRKIIEARRLT